MNDVAFIQQKFGKVGAVLAGDAGDEGGFWGHFKVQVKRFKMQDSRGKGQGARSPSSCILHLVEFKDKR